MAYYPPKVCDTFIRFSEAVPLESLHEPRKVRRAANHFKTFASGDVSKAFDQRVQTCVADFAGRIRIRDKVPDDRSSRVGAKKETCADRHLAVEDNGTNRRKESRVWSRKLAKIKPGFQKIEVFLRLVLKY
ncbi:MAG: hypothetical protein JNL01_13990 [Bdellovibrionales bacterium]|nr:hypothetical protein [Bdellovibrionales bacterium]